jgi:hypothetical protein
LLAFAADAAAGDDDDENFCEMNKFQNILGVVFTTAFPTDLWLIVLHFRH